jgi:hypothetical protein
MRLTMLDLIFVALLQAAAGDPAVPADTPTAAQTEETPTEQVTVQQPAPAEDERVRCRREPVVGTRLSRRICTTAAQDRALADDARDMVNRAQGQMTVREN